MKWRNGGVNGEYQWRRNVSSIESNGEMKEKAIMAAWRGGNISISGNGNESEMK
jgi:hypothetical protein